MDQSEIAVDQFMTVGTNHHVCQDYVISRKEDPPRLILSDGCSSSLDTDIGSRLWVRSANVDILQSRGGFQNSLYSPEKLIATDKLGLSFIAARIGGRVERIGDMLELAYNMPDCTLLMAYHFALENLTRIMIFGDGVFFIKKTDGLHIFRIEFSHNAPYYPSYLLSVKRQNDYFKISKELDAKVEVTYYEPGVEAINTTFENIEDWPGYFMEISDGFECIGIASDGICQIKERGTANFLHVKKVLKDFLAFKGVNGDFVKRRVGRALEDYAKEGYYPSDDLSIAVMLNKDVWNGENTRSVTGA